MALRLGDGDDGDGDAICDIVPYYANVELDGWMEGREAGAAGGRIGWMRREESEKREEKEKERGEGERRGEDGGARLSSSPTMAAAGGESKSNSKNEKRVWSTEDPVQLEKFDFLNSKMSIRKIHRGAREI